MTTMYGIVRHQKQGEGGTIYYSSARAGVESWISWCPIDGVGFPLRGV